MTSRKDAVAHYMAQAALAKSLIAGFTAGDMADAAAGGFERGALAEPAAPAVDLEQFRDAVVAARKWAWVTNDSSAESRFLNLLCSIDLQAGAPPVIPAHVRSVLAEIERATAKFPTWPTDPLHAYAVFNEEAGELGKAVLQAVYEPHKSGPAEVATEAVQAAAMALRFIASLDRYEYTPGAQHQQAGKGAQP